MMADTLGIHVSQLKRYEAGTSQPTLEVFRKNGREPDEDLRLHFEAVSNLDDEEKSVIKELIEGMLIKHDAKRWTTVSNQA